MKVNLPSNCLSKQTYRVEKQILLVEFFVYVYSMVHDINLKIGIDDMTLTSYPMIALSDHVVQRQGKVRIDIL